jgi:ATP-dependent Clp protease ATP-binding subunit ClpA
MRYDSHHRCKEDIRTRDGELLWPEVIDDKALAKKIKMMELDPSMMNTEYQMQQGRIDWVAGTHDLAEKVIALARQEVSRYRNRWMEPFHVLLGIVKEASVADIMKHLDVDLRKIRIEVEKRIEPGNHDADSMSLTTRTYEALDRARRFAEFDDELIGPSHLLMGVVQDDGVAGQVLQSLGVSVQKVQEAKELVASGAKCVSMMSKILRGQQRIEMAIAAQSQGEKPIRRNMLEKIMSQSPPDSDGVPVTDKQWEQLIDQGIAEAGSYAQMIGLIKALRPLIQKIVREELKKP